MAKRIALLFAILLMMILPVLGQDETATPTDSVVVTAEPTEGLPIATVTASNFVTPTDDAPAATQEVIVIVTLTPEFSPTPTLTPSPEPTLAPPAVVIPSSQDTAIAGVNAFYAFLAGLGVGGLGVAGVLLLGVTVILRSPVLLTAIEGLVYSKLDTEGIKKLRGVGEVLDKAGELIDKVTDGLPNEPAGTQVTVTTTPGTSAG